MEVVVEDEAVEEEAVEEEAVVEEEAGRLTDDPREVLVADLRHLEEPGAGADVFLARLRRAVDDGGAGGARDPVVVGLADAADHRDVRLAEVVLREKGAEGRGAGERERRWVGRLS